MRGTSTSTRSPAEWATTASSDYGEALEQMELADRVGLDSVWEVEHSFLEDTRTRHASSMLLGAASQRSGAERRDPARLPASRAHSQTAAMLDLVSSSGAGELGTARDLERGRARGFGVDREGRRARWEELLGVVARMMVEEPARPRRRARLSMPPRNVVPRPSRNRIAAGWRAGGARRSGSRSEGSARSGSRSSSPRRPPVGRRVPRDRQRAVRNLGCAVNPNVGASCR